MADQTAVRLENAASASDIAEWRRQIRELGTALTPALIEGTKQLCEAALDPGFLNEVEVARDEAYGDDERHRLDVYAEQTQPLTAIYAERGLLRQVDGLGEVEAVTDRIRAAIGR